MNISDSTQAWRGVSADRLYKQDATNGSPKKVRDGLALVIIGTSLGAPPRPTTEFEHRVKKVTDGFQAGEVYEELLSLRNESYLKGAVTSTATVAAVGGTAYLAHTGWVGAAVATGIAGAVAGYAAFSSFKGAQEFQTLARKTESLGQEVASGPLAFAPKG